MIPSETFDGGDETEEQVHTVVKLIPPLLRQHDPQSGCSILKYRKKVLIDIVHI